jgi:hypothetical protein
VAPLLPSVRPAALEAVCTQGFPSPAAASFRAGRTAGTRRWDTLNSQRRNLSHDSMVRRHCFCGRVYCRRDDGCGDRSADAEPVAHGIRVADAGSNDASLRRRSTRDSVNAARGVRVDKLWVTQHSCGALVDSGARVLKVRRCFDSMQALRQMTQCGVYRAAIGST